MPSAASLPPPPGVLDKPHGNSRFTPQGVQARNGLMQRPSTDARTAQLRDFLHAKSQEQFSRTIAREAQKMGITLDGPITDKAVIEQLGKRADFASDSVRRTYLKQMADAQAQGLTPTDVVDARDYKPTQVFNYELGLAQHSALTSFYEQNSHIPAMAHADPPDTDQEDACNEWIDLGSIAVSDIPGDLPAHPNCIHAWVTEPGDDPTLIPAGADLGDGETADEPIPASQATAKWLTAAGLWTAGMAIVAALGDTDKQDQQQQADSSTFTTDATAEFTALLDATFSTGDAMSVTTTEPDALASITETATLNDATFSDDDVVVRTGKLFECGSYPDKQFTFNEDDMQAAIAAFEPVYVDLEHTPTVLERRLGTVQRIYPGDDGRSLMGEVHLPKWLDAVLDDGSRKVSATWDRATKTLRGLALVRSPRVADAALMAAFAEVEKSPGVRADNGKYSRHDTPHGQVAIQAIHDTAVKGGAVCAVPMASVHETNAIQSVHDMAVQHGAVCAPVTNSITPSTKKRPTRSIRMNLKDLLRPVIQEKADEKGVEFNDADFDALFDNAAAEKVAELEARDLSRQAEVDELKREAAEHQAAFARVEQERRQAEAVTFAQTQVSAHRVVPGAAEKLAALVTRIASTDATATFADGEQSTLVLLQEFIDAQPDLSVFTTNSIKPEMAAALFNTTTTSDPTKPSLQAQRAEADKVLAATPEGRAALAARTAQN